MRTPFHVQATDDLSAFATFCGKPGFTADTVAAHRADGHLVAAKKWRCYTDTIRQVLQEQLNATGCDAEFLTPAQTIEKIRNDAAKWGRVVKDANIKAE